MIHYAQNLIEICNTIIAETKNNLNFKHPLMIEFRAEIYEATKEFPDKISLPERLRAIAKNDNCTCTNCGTIHGHPGKIGCCRSCIWTIKHPNKLTEEELAAKELQFYINRAEAKFVGKIENEDFVICKICGQKGADLGTHIIDRHKITVAEYKSQFLGASIKSQRIRDNLKGNKNPAYNHGGRLSPWSKNFLYGYNEERHNLQIKKHKQMLIDNRENNKFNIEYWLRKTDNNKELAKELYSKFQTRDLAWFMSKFGKEEGVTRHRNKIEKWLNTLKSKSIEELARINTSKVRKSTRSYSKAEKELFNVLKSKIPDMKDQLAICKDLSNPYKRFYLYDMAYKNKIIEYNGVFWHAHSNFYDEKFVNPYNHRTYKEIHDRDAHKLKVAENAGYSVHVVWEHEYNENKSKVIEECLVFLKQ